MKKKILCLLANVALIFSGGITLILCSSVSEVIQGEREKTGEKGDQGEKGDSPYVGDNGNWWVGEEYTGISAFGTQNIDGLSFHPLDDGTYGVSVGTADNLSSVSIPSQFNNKSVTKIIDAGFKGFKKLRSVNIPSTVSSIGESAFEDCSSLETVVVDDEEQNLTVIKTTRDYVVGGLDSAITVENDAFKSTIMFFCRKIYKYLFITT